MNLREEASSSRSGKHAVRELVLEVCEDRVFEPRIKKRRSVKPTYSQGQAYEIEVEPEPNCALVHVRIVKCLGRRFKGVITVYREANVALRVKYVNGLIRRSCGDSSYFRVVEHVLSSLRIPYRRVNLSTGVERC